MKEAAEGMHDVTNLYLAERKLAVRTFQSSKACMVVKNLFLSIIVLWAFVGFASAQVIDLFPVEREGKAGYIDHTGKVVIPLKYDEVRGFSEGLAAVRAGQDWGFIDKSGKFEIKPQFFSASGFREGIANVGVYWNRRAIIKSTVGYDGYIDKNGKMITQNRFGVGFSFSDGLAAIQTEDYKNGFIDHTGKIVLFADTYENQFNDGRALFKTMGNMPDSRTGYIDKTGKAVIPAIYLGGETFSEGLACVHAETGSGFIDTDGKIVINLKFDDCKSFSEGLAAVRIDDKYGFIDRSGTIVIYPQFAEAEPFSDGVAIVRVGETEKRTADGLRSVTITPERNMIAVKNGAFGVIDKTGKFIVPTKYIQIGAFRGGLAWANLSDRYLVHGDTDRWGYINKQGKIVWKSF